MYGKHTFKKKERGGGNRGTQLLTSFSSYPLFPVSRLFLYLFPSDSSPLSCLCLHCFVKPSLWINPRLAALGAKSHTGGTGCHSAFLGDWCKLLLSPFFPSAALCVSLSTSHFSFSAIYLKPCGFLYLVCVLDAALCVVFFVSSCLQNKILFYRVCLLVWRAQDTMSS